MTDAPGWFTAALAQPPELLGHEVDGVRLRYRAWGGRGLPLVLLVHGGTAHSAWWDHVGPLAALVAREGDGGRPVVVGHSMGGWVSMTLAATHPDLPAELVVVDSPLRVLAPDPEVERRRTQAHARVYPAREDAVARFRLTPPQDRAVLPFVFDHIAATSVREIEAGWGWKFDPEIWRRHRGDPPELAAITCPVTLLAAERGMQSTEDAGRAAARIAGPVTIAQIPDAGHHVMVDEPLALVTALRVVLGRPA